MDMRAGSTEYRWTCEQEVLSTGGHKTRKYWVQMDTGHRSTHTLLILWQVMFTWVLQHMQEIEMEVSGTCDCYSN